VESPLPLDVDHSHLFPGARLSCIEGEPPSAGSPTEALVRFGDGAQAPASLDVLHETAGRYLLDVGPYETAAGTGMPAKAWVVELDGGQGSEWTLLVKAKAD
jgi:hypothetical protein